MWSIILDLILLLIAGSTIYFATKRGLVRTVINALSLILSALLSVFISPIFKNYISFSGEHGEVATYFIIFVISWIIVKIASSLLDKIISALPIIRTMNSLGGLILGILLGIFRISLYCIAVVALLTIGEKYGLSFVENFSIEDTVIVKYFYEYNPIYILLQFIMK